MMQSANTSLRNFADTGLTIFVIVAASKEIHGTASQSWRSGQPGKNQTGARKAR
jgi:hypothetical protein